MNEDMRFNIGLLVFLLLLLIALPTLPDAQSRFSFIITGGISFLAGWFIGGKLKKRKS